MGGAGILGKVVKKDKRGNTLLRREEASYIRSREKIVRKRGDSKYKSPEAGKNMSHLRN